MKTIIREMTEDDLLDVLIVGREFSREAPKSHKWDRDKTIEFLKNALVSPQYQIFVSETDGEVNGGIVCAITSLLMSHTTVASELVWFVSKEARGKPSSIKLVKRFESWAKENGAQYVFMGDITQVGDLGNLYKRMGYHAVETAYMKEI